VVDYFHKINSIRRKYNALFYMVLHDLVPIFARETCDQGTAMVFEDFLKKSFGIVDTYICISENTKNDLLRYCEELGQPAPSAVVVTNGCELAKPMQESKNLPSVYALGSFVLFVSTIEGRKNHVLALKTWTRLVLEREDVPKLVCVGRYGWRAEEFIRTIVASDGLGKKIEILSEVSDEELEELYANCLFTIYPSFYEGWGLPVTESLARGKVCVSSYTSSLREAGGDLAIYIDPHSNDQLYRAVSDLLEDPDLIVEREERIRNEFVLRPWSQVAQDYLKAAIQPSKTQLKRNCFVSVVAGKEYILKRIPSSFDGHVGDELRKSIENAYLGPIMSGSIGVQDAIDGLSLRGHGSWMEPEDWGTWLGIDGGSIDFWWEGPETEVSCALLGRVLSCFQGREIRYSINGRACKHKEYLSKFHTHLHVMSVTMKRGLNSLAFGIAVNDEDRALSAQLDNRRLMVGVTAVTFIDKRDVEKRLNLLETTFEIVSGVRG